jgi:hypothetical protein
VDKEDREFRFGGVRAVPVGESLCWGPIRAKEREWAEGEDSGKSEERSAVEVEGVVLQVAGC